MKVRYYRCRTFDETTGKWDVSRVRFDLATIALFPNSEPIMDDWEEREVPDDPSRNSTGHAYVGHRGLE